MANEPKNQQPAQQPSSADRQYRRDVAKEAFGATIHRHGGFGHNQSEREVLLRLIWTMTDEFIALENAPPLKPAPVPELPDVTRRRRPVAPDDEWAVLTQPDNKVHKGFPSREEAERFAAGYREAEIFQVSGPEVKAAQLVAPASA